MFIYALLVYLLSYYCFIYMLWVMTFICRSKYVYRFIYIYYVLVNIYIVL